MLNIKLNEQYQITSDERNYILNEVKTAKSGKNEGKEYFNPIGYHGNLKDLIDQYININLLKSNCNNFEEVSEKLTDICKTIEDIRNRIIV